MTEFKMAAMSELRQSRLSWSSCDWFEWLAWGEELPISGPSLVHLMERNNYGTLRHSWVTEMHSTFIRCHHTWGEELPMPEATFPEERMLWHLLCKAHTSTSYRPQRSCGQGNIFTPVCHSFCSQGGRGSASVHAGIPAPLSRHPPKQTPPPEQTPLGADNPPEQTASLGADPPPREQTPLGADPPGADAPLSRGRPPWEQTPPLGPDPPWSRHPPRPAPLEQTPPPQEANSSIRSTSGRYASYWNAFL